MASEQAVPVRLYIYDLTNGLASVLSPAILGRQVQGVWHTAIVVYDREYFFGSGGITTCAPGGTQLGAPHQVEELGDTFVPLGVFKDYIQGLASTTYTGSSYRLLEHNCNHFSDEVAQFLCGARVPKHILTQPDQLPAPLRMALAAMLDNLVPNSSPEVYGAGVRHARQESPEFNSLNDEIAQARAASAELGQRRDKLARKERRRERKRHKQGLPELTDMAEAVEAMSEVAAGPSAGPAAGAAARGLSMDEREEEDARRRARDPPVLFRDMDGAAEFEALSAALADAALSEAEQQSLNELQQYLVLGEGSWVLGDDFLAFIERILQDETLEPARLACLRCLGAMALRDDVSLLLHQDRRHHALLGYAHRVDLLPLPEQRAVATFMCNLFEHMSSSEWLLYISEWEHAGQPLSNIRATTKVCVHATLSDDGELRDVGTALMYNVATKEVKTVVFDEVSVELAMALLELAKREPSEEHMWRALVALARLAQHSQDVPQFIQMLGPDPAAFRGMSPRVDEQIDIIAKKLK